MLLPEDAGCVNYPELEASHGNISHNHMARLTCNDNISIRIQTAQLVVSPRAKMIVKCWNPIIVELQHFVILLTNKLSLLHLGYIFTEIPGFTKHSLSEPLTPHSPYIYTDKIKGYTLTLFSVHQAPEILWGKDADGVS